MIDNCPKCTAKGVIKEYSCYDYLLMEREYRSRNPLISTYMISDTLYNLLYHQSSIKLKLKRHQNLIERNLDKDLKSRETFSDEENKAVEKELSTRYQHVFLCLI